MNVDKESKEKSIAIKEEDIKRLEDAGFRFLGKYKHSAIKTCEWTRKALRNDGFCYKQKFYGIASHRCLQFTPALPFCTHRCLFCWRDINITYPKWIGNVDDPKDLLEEAIEKQREILQGFKGNPKVDKQRFYEAMLPNQIAISLAGEPTLYPKLPELIDETKKRGMSSFLVSNGTIPNMIKRIIKNPPTQLYITLPAPDEDIYIKTCNPILKNSWKKIIKSLSLLKLFEEKARIVVRLTLVKNLNFFKPEVYGKIIKEFQPQFVEVKSFMSVGFARARLPYEAMPLHEEIKKFSKKLAKCCNYKIIDEKKESRVVLLKRNK
ncbi:MAG: 4-demethylwyosine synthase TYW1 [Candidatus Aenigmatarchaeota archaeon]